MTATEKALRVAFAAYDERTRAHAAGNDSHIAFARPHRAFARHQDVLAEMRFARHIVVVTVDRLYRRVEGRRVARRPDSAYNLFHHQAPAATMDKETLTVVLPLNHRASQGRPGVEPGSRILCGGRHLEAGIRVDSGFGQRAGFAEPPVAGDQAHDFITRKNELPGWEIGGWVVRLAFALS